MKKPKNKKSNQESDRRVANRGGHEVTYEPTPEEILEVGKRMREQGWTDRNGHWHPPIGERWEYED